MIAEQERSDSDSTWLIRKRMGREWHYASWNITSESEKIDAFSVCVRVVFWIRGYVATAQGDALVILSPGDSGNWAEQHDTPPLPPKNWSTTWISACLTFLPHASRLVSDFMQAIVKVDIEFVFCGYSESSLVSFGLAISEQLVASEKSKYGWPAR